MPLNSGTLEEQATFGTLELRANGRCLTEGVAEGNELLPGPRAAGYYLAEWLAWNWWRLLWEADSANPGRDWAFAHCLSSIGEGYVWPNIEISSDGVYARIASARTTDSAPGLYRYVGAPGSEVVAAADLAAAISRFVQVVLDLLNGADVAATNLHRIWNDLEAARQDAIATRLRRIEAHWGCDPDEADATLVRAAMDSANDLGSDAVDELVADAGASRSKAVLSSKELIGVAKASGSAARPQEGATLPQGDDRHKFGTVVAWRCGIGAAEALRQQEALDGRPIANKTLTDLAGTRANALRPANGQTSPLAFMLTARGGSWVALRSKWETGRRFDLARLLGDRLLGQEEPLLPATRAYTYRQKAQRAFAAELLCPYQAVREFLGVDRSEERREEAADHFNVSPLAISTVLTNNEPELQPIFVGRTPTR